MLGSILVDGHQQRGVRGWDMIDVTEQDFEQQVVEKSHEVPVIVDLWAPWCEPCKTLGPLLEKVIDAQQGKVIGVKIDIDENPGISQAFQVQSIPMVVAFKDGQAVDGFMGAQGEPMLQDFIARLLPTEEESQIDSLVSAGDELSLRAALKLQSDHPPAVLALAELLVQDGRADEGLELLGRIPESSESRRIAAVARTSDSSGQSDEVDAELLTLLSQVKTDDSARQRFVDLLEVMGPDDPRTGEWRRKLSTALF
ncbi:MAG: tetratricopeptide repeat protein [Actinomycetota bacterium]|nr:tetratricopeptide repeat protein [Acidimicrobiales bacterium]MEC7873216.1 tetratricopeptide repeat protein [Actinomycetota bacterium]MEC8923693.1 tetratricopeptide repeat protein [Actinomycetota bacterium]